MEDKSTAITEEDEYWRFFCPHGEEVTTPDGACYRCAQEDATYADY